jgi:5-methylcytosine-specific restriction protein A
MPNKPPSACRHPGCPARVYAGGGYCDRHRRPARADWQDNRAPSSQRGYDQRWHQLRRWYIQQHPLCEVCYDEPAEIVHHKRPVRDDPEERLSVDNLQSVCRVCHARLHPQGGE